jgi:hypothetical protein
MPDASRQCSGLLKWTLEDVRGFNDPELVPVHATKAYRERRDREFHSFLTSALDRGDW